MTQDVLFRLAIGADLPSIVRMLADDELGSQREKYEDPLPESYYSAFEQINNDPNHELISAERNGEVIGRLVRCISGSYRLLAFKADCVHRSNQ